MPGWLNDAQPFQNNENGAFNPNGEPSMPFMQTPASSSSFDFNQLQNQQLQQQQQQRMQNGNIRNGSPAFHNPMYNTQSMIPSKRPRPREDSIGASPQQHPGALPGSRSQTPQQALHAGYQASVNGNQQFPGASPYQQFQQPNSHANHSPIVQNQPFNPQAPHHRVQTMSPSPFSPATQNFATHTSPPQSENGSRVNTPHNGATQYPQGMPYGAPPNQQYTPPFASTANGAGLAQYNQHLQNQHQQQQMRIQEARVQQLQQQRQQGGMGSMAQPPNQISAQQMQAVRAQQAQQAQQQHRPSNPEQLSRTIAQWAQQNGQHYDPQPVINGKSISSVQLFMGVMKMGGSKRVTATNQWPSVSNFLQFPPPQQIAAAQDLQRYWHQNLSGYEQYFGLQQQQRRAMADAHRPPAQMQGGDMARRQELFSPTKQIANQPPQQLMQHPPHMQAQFQTPTKHMTPQHDPRQPLQNGYMTPQQSQARHPNIYSLPQPPMQPHARTIPPQETQKTSTAATKAMDAGPKTDPYPPKVPSATLGTNYEPKADIQEGGIPRTYGGVELEPRHFVNTVDYLLKYKLSTPKVEELGLLDIQALALSLRSGINAEVRLALDTLATLSKERDRHTTLVLDSCEDLLEALIDCADDQVQLLAENSPEVSDEMLVNSYEETIRGCKVENATLQELPEFGTLDYELDRAADRLICITTILRNFSFPESNQVILADPIVIRFLATVIRYIGTRSMLLRTHLNLLDFSKDVLVFLSNVSHWMDLPGKEEAFCILHFLLSFAPWPSPNSTEEQDCINFSPYTAGIHRYYPHAVDSLAKLLARGDPNRTFFRLIFAADSASSPSFDLLTRSFGLAIAAIPEIGKFGIITPIINARAPCILQGLLAAEILTSLIPSTEHDIAGSWLNSRDGFALSLLRIATEVGKAPPPPQPPARHPSGRQLDPDPFGYTTITERGFGVLKKLAEKAKDANGNSKDLPQGMIPDKRTVISALVHPTLRSPIKRQLSALSSLAS